MAVHVPPWLDKVKLQQWLGTEVTECINKDSGKKGDSHLCDILRIVAKTKEGDKALIVKFRKTDAVAADIFRESALFKKEEDMYGTTLPKLEKILSRVVPKESASLGPKCWYSCNDFLIMDDLVAEGFKMQDRQVGMNLAQSLSVMRNIANFHAASIALIEEEPKSMDGYDINFFAEPSTYHAWNTLFTAMATMLIEELETWPAEWASYMEKIKAMKYGILDRMNKVTKQCDSNFNVLVHGDLWVNNMLFKNDDVIRFIDYQLVHYSTFMIDLHYFLATSPNMDVRINHLDSLFKEYHSTLTSTMTLLGCKRKLPTLEELYSEFQQKSLYGVFAIISPAAMMLAGSDCEFDIFEAMQGRTPGPKMYSDYYKEAVKFHLPFLDKMGGLDYK